MKCRFCNTPLSYELIDLSPTPPSNSYLNKSQLNEPEIFYPLKIFICDNCKLVQSDEIKKSNDIFNKDYAYFSSFSSSWLQHSKNYVEMIIKKLSLSKNTFVTEIASNDGYLLQYFKEKEIPCIGIEPTYNTAKAAQEKGIEVIIDFFTDSLAKKLTKSDLILGNNVLAHVPNINDFVAGLKSALKETGTITLEFPHLLNLLQENQFDTIYHEHFSYLSLYTSNKIFQKHGLTIYDVEKLKTHGGSLRIYATHSNKNMLISEKFTAILNEEISYGLLHMNAYIKFQDKANEIKNNLLRCLLDIKKNNKKVIAYGAAAKGNTLLNYAGIKKDLISFVVDKSPHKQDKYLPASHIPIIDESNIKKYKPEYILILPWNLQKEIIEQLAYVREWGCKFITAIPQLKVIN